MNDLEKSIIELNMSIDDLYKKRADIQSKRVEVRSRKDGAYEKERRYSNKVERLSNELDALMTKRLSLVTIPSLGVWLPLLALVFEAPLGIVAAIGILGAVSGYRFASDLVHHKMLTKGDMRLLTRLFPSIKTKSAELEKACSDRKNYSDKLVELTSEEDTINEEYDELDDGIRKLEDVSKSMCELHFSKLQRELLPHYTDLETVIGRTISNPEKFYSNICNGLTRKERNDIIAEMSCKSCENCTYTGCTLSDEEKAQNGVCENWYNEIEIGKSKVLRR